MQFRSRAYLGNLPMKMRVRPGCGSQLRTVFLLPSLRLLCVDLASGLGQQELLSPPNSDFWKRDPALNR